MSQLRLVVLLPLISAAGCYSDAPPASTFPDDHYVSGPPGGAMDPEPAAYANAPDEPGALEAGGTPDLVGGNADDQASEAPSAPDLAPSGPAVAAPAPGDDGDPAYADDGVAQGEVNVSGGVTLDAGAPAPTASVTDVEINAALEGHGEWVENDEYGAIWRPDATQVGVDFTPYESGGSWAYTDAGWGFNCDYSWGWLPFHYGRWGFFGDSWGWVPGYDWSPAWVEWRHGGGVVGWRPLPPRDRGHFYPGTRHNLPRDHRRAAVYNAHWRFATTSDFSRRNIRAHLYRNPAEGLRVTARVNAPPLRGRTAIRTGDLMRNRYLGAGRPVYGGTRTAPNQGIRRDPRYQAYGPQRPYAPGSRELRPRPEGRVQPYDRRVQPYDGRGSAPAGSAAEGQRGSIDGRTQVYSGPRVQRAQPYNTGRAPDRSVQPYNPGTRTYQPGSAPPGRSQGYNPGTRTVQPGPRYAPPSRTVSPGAPARTWNASPSSPPPSRSWNPPSAPSTRAPVSAPPSRSWSPPSAPSRSAPAPAPSRSSAPSSSGSRNDGGGRSGGAGGGHSSRR